ncbi:peptide ABC transporter permease [Vulcanimicrobium alpinum]|uniref:Peptide ABC transporter permease n=1 Tax=Vulcanimicrobium alpinum TaxID=3016050 RepID=A0AAN1XWK1_UNVUL|nr:ABC transporter permease [Vulcanimicrobium alpinum]BDE05602.1 peptide ABC transporter permease [Vulcanimicrobium alpinum]
MAAFLARRALGAVWALAGVAIVVFLILHLTGDPAAVMMPPESTQAEIDAFRHAQGFDRPLPVQFASFALAAAHGDLGVSLRHQEPAMSLALKRFPATILLAGSAFAIVLLVGVPAGVASALRPRTWIDYTARIVALIGQSAPTYWIGLMLILLFAVRLGWVPASGIGDWRNVILPAATLGFFSTAKLMRLTRAAMLDVLTSDYLRTARAKGLTGTRVVLAHALRNAWIPIVTQLGVELGTLLSGAIITETVFAWPGVGRLAVQAVFERDFPVVEAVVLLAATTFVLLNLVVDLLYAALDPRIRYA